MSEARKTTKTKSVKRYKAETGQTVSTASDSATVKKPRRRIGTPKFLSGITGYFKGSWQELRLAKWPDRRSTWSLTAAVLAFTVFIMLFIVAVDYAFNALFERLIA